MLKTITVTMYEADDRTRFQDRNEADKYQSALEACRDIERLLPPRQNIPHTRWVQHPIAQYQAWRIALIRLTLKYYPEELPKHVDPMKVRPQGYLARLVRRTRSSRLRKLWHRFACTDDDGREFSQPYFALHPREAEGPFIEGDYSL